MPGHQPLDRTSRYLLDAVRALGSGAPLPTPPPDGQWRDRAAQHGVLSMLDAAVRATPDRDRPPPDRCAQDWVEQIATQFSVVAQHEVGLRDLRTVAEALNRERVDWALFKGPVLSYDVYRNPDIRWFTDLDLLVRPEDFPTALDGLQAAGAQLLDRNWSAALHQRASELSLRMPLGTTVDLHWHVVGRAAQRDHLRMATAELLARTREVTLDGELTVPTFDELDTVLHLAVHGALSGGYLLRWLIDLQQAVQRYRPDPSRLGARARAQGTALAAQLMLDRAADYVDPGLTRYRGALARRSPMAALGRVWSARFPPGLSRQGTQARGGRALYQTVAGTELSTATALVRELAYPDGHPRWAHRRRRAAAAGRPRPGERLRLADGEQDRATYLTAVTAGTL